MSDAGRTYFTVSEVAHCHIRFSHSPLKSTDLVPRHVADFVTGAIVAIEATVATYDFTGSDGSHRSGYSLGLREVYWLREDEDRGNPATPSKKRQAGGELISPRSYARQKKGAT